MPWKETCVMSERRLLIEVLAEGVSVSEAARALGISRKTAYKWLARHREGGFAALADRSRARHVQEHATSEVVRDLLIGLRKRTGSGPRQLLWLARREGWDIELPAVSTVSSILKKAGLVKSCGRRRRDPQLRGVSVAYRAGTSANEQWTVDFKGQFRLGDRSMCYPLTVQDDATRYVLCVDGHGSTATEGVLASFRRTFQKHGIPQRLHSDNGSPFAGTGIGRLSRVSVEWMRQGIEVSRSRPSHPQDNPRHERMHRTLKKETACPPSGTMSGQQRRFWRFMRWMNEERGHEGIGMRAPAELHVASPREWEANPKAPEYAGHWEVRSVRSNGEMKLKGRLVFLSEALGGELVGLEEIEDGIWRASYRRSVLCLIDVRGKEARVMTNNASTRQSG